MTFAIPLASFNPSELRGKLRRWHSLLPIIEGHERELGALADHDLRKRSLSLRYRAKSHEPLDRLRLKIHRELGQDLCIDSA